MATLDSPATSDGPGASVIYDVPVRHTTRPVVRRFHPRDVDACAVIMADPAVVRFLSDGMLFSHANAWRQLAKIAGHWMLRGFG